MTEGSPVAKKAHPFILIVGTSRSGTTLIGQLLSRHPDVFISPETKFFFRIWSQRKYLARLSPADRIERMVACLIRSEYPWENRTFPAHREAFARILADHPNHHDAFFALIQELSDRPILGEKTPSHLQFVEDILACDRPVQVLAMVRSPGAVIASQRARKLEIRNKPIAYGAERWCILNRHVLKLSRRLGPERFRIVRFEDLMADPAATMAGVCDWIGIDLQPQMLEPDYQHSAYRRGREAKGFDRGAVDRWRQHMDPADIRVVEAVTCDVARQFGYDLPAGRIGPINQFRRLLSRLVTWRSSCRARKGWACRGAHHGMPPLPDDHPDVLARSEGVQIPQE